MVRSHSLRNVMIYFTEETRSNLYRCFRCSSQEVFSLPEYEQIFKAPVGIGRSIIFIEDFFNLLVDQVCFCFLYAKVKGIVWSCIKMSILFPLIAPPVFSDKCAQPFPVNFTPKGITSGSAIVCCSLAKGAAFVIPSLLHSILSMGNRRSL